MLDLAQVSSPVSSKLMQVGNELTLVPSPRPQRSVENPAAGNMAPAVQHNGGQWQGQAQGPQQQAVSAASCSWLRRALFFSHMRSPAGRRKGPPTRRPRPEPGVSAATKEVAVVPDRARQRRETEGVKAAARKVNHAA